VNGSAVPDAILAVGTDTDSDYAGWGEHADVRSVRNDAQFPHEGIHIPDRGYTRR